MSPDLSPPEPADGPAPSRRRFLTYLVAAPTLAVAARIGTDAAAPATTGTQPSRGAMT